MPIPVPQPGEGENEFVSRCMAQIGTEYDQDTALAICYDTYNRNTAKWDEIEKVLPVDQPPVDHIREKALTHNSNVADSEPAWSSVDKTKLPYRAFVWQEEGTDPDSKSTWKYPHHWVRNGGELNEDGVYSSGDMYLHQGGLNAAWAAANGARSGQQASQTIKNHLQRHRRALGLDTEKVTKDDMKALEKIQSIQDDNPNRVSTQTFGGVSDYDKPEGILAGNYPEFDTEDTNPPRSHRDVANDLDELFPIE